MQLTDGAPIPSRDGHLVERWGDRQFAVLEYVGGNPLLATPEDQQAVGTTLARVHQLSQTPVGDLEKPGASQPTYKPASPPPTATRSA
ncbi:hypothetical protein OHA70_03450 [Kribbella sp. NBC_00382]|uniref:hypothetical protein n=1 Tax=Kribbella sp. NBC_00382 TaxID=2975967 RepID=UPI002E1A8692